MSLKATWRWFGPDDPVSLEDIRQTGAEGIVTSLHHIRAGNPWAPAEIKSRKRKIEAAGFKWEIVESLPVHESIKTGSEEADTYIQHYITSLQNLAAEGIRHVVYNFMALTDWTRTDLKYMDTDGAQTIRYDAVDLAMFDIHILGRKGATEEIPQNLREQAAERYESISEKRIQELSTVVMMGLPGTVEDLAVGDFRDQLKIYSHIGKEGLRKNLAYFLSKVIPEAEKLGITMSIHADDPPWPIFGLPRIVSNREDLEYIMGLHDSPSNRICFCTGTFGASKENDVPAMLQRFAPRISFAHLRNVKQEEDGSFYESKIFEGSLNMTSIIKILLTEQKRRGIDHPIPFRPDHGQVILDDSRRHTYPGYPVIGRLKSLAELRGIIHVLSSADR